MAIGASGVVVAGSPSSARSAARDASKRTLDDPSCELAAYWKLNGGGADAVGGNSLMPFGTVGFTTGQLGFCADFDGSTSSHLRASAPHTYDLEPSGFTVEFWSKVRGLPSVDPRIVRADSSGDQEAWEVGICNLSCGRGRLIVGAHHLGATAFEFLSNQVLNDGVWHHIALTYDGAVVVLYVDGSVDYTLSQVGIEANVGGGTITLGNSSSDANRFDGQIDEFRIWNVARSAAEIQADMHRELTVPLIAYWKLNGNGADAVAGNTLVALGNVAYPTGELGLCADIDGLVTSHLRAPALPAYDLKPTGFTLEFWTRVRSLPGYDPRIVRADYSGDQEAWEVGICNLSCGPGRLIVGAHHLGETAFEFLSNQVIGDGSWHHVAVTYDGVTVLLYVDGASDVALSQPGILANVGGGTITLGNSSDDANQFDGEIDEFRIWSVARSQAEIQADMYREVCPIGPLVAVDPQRGEPNWLGLVKPNPIVRSCVIEYAISRRGNVSGAVFDVAGARVRVLTTGVAEAGRNMIRWDGSDGAGGSCKPGMYWIVLRTPDGTFSRAVTILR